MLASSVTTAGPASRSANARHLARASCRLMLAAQSNARGSGLRARGTQLRARQNAPDTARAHLSCAARERPIARARTAARSAPTDRGTADTRTTACADGALPRAQPPLHARERPLHATISPRRPLSWTGASRHAHRRRKCRQCAPPSQPCRRTQSLFAWPPPHAFRNSATARHPPAAKPRAPAHAAAHMRAFRFLPVYFVSGAMPTYPFCRI